MTLARLVMTVGHVGRLRPASGTWGSLAALPLAWGLHAAGGPWLLALACPLVFALGLQAVAQETAGDADPDRSEIVVDEVVGQWIALLPVSAGAAIAGADVLALWPGIVAAFLGFRFFDIVKVWPASVLDRRKDPMGVMADDVIAGLYAALLVAALAALAHLWLLGAG
jgi:phosphatidylglycerophosphatase A